jgi:SAM-dependent methyltransferase
LHWFLDLDEANEKAEAWDVEYTKNITQPDRPGNTDNAVRVHPNRSQQTPIAQHSVEVRGPLAETTLARLFLWLTDRSRRIRPFLFRIFFDQLARRTSAADWWTFMNYGYAEIGGEGAGAAHDPADEPERYCRQLYQRVTTGVDLAGKDVLEVSCGRGGGASFVCRHLKPRTMTALDNARSAIDFCLRTHSMPGLRFLVGNAENLPIPDESVDAVINVEASFCYGRIERFFSEVRRVLRPAGCFLYADLRFVHEVDEWLAAIGRSGFTVELVEDITPNVAHALALDSRRRLAANRRLIPWPLRGTLHTFIGAEGTRYPMLLRNGKLRYMRFVLRKSGGVESH